MIFSIVVSFVVPILGIVGYIVGWNVLTYIGAVICILFALQRISRADFTPLIHVVVTALFAIFAARVFECAYLPVASCLICGDYIILTITDIVRFHDMTH